MTSYERERLERLERELERVKGGDLRTDTLIIGTGKGRPVRLMFRVDWPEVSSTTVDDTPLPWIGYAPTAAGTAEINYGILTAPTGDVASASSSILYGPDDITLSGALSGTSFEPSVPIKRKGCVLASHTRILRVSGTDGSIDSGCDFTVSADGLTITTAIAPGLGSAFWIVQAVRLLS